MATAAEGHVGEGVLRVLLARRGEAVGIEALRLGEAGGIEVRERRRHRDDRALRHHVARVVEVDERGARQPDQRRVQAQRLLHRVLELRDLAQRLVADLAAVGVDAVELLAHALHELRRAQQLDQRPGGGAGAGVVPGEHGRDQDAGDDGGRVAERLAVLQREQDAEQVARRLRHRLALADHARDQLDQALARAVAHAEGLDVHAASSGSRSRRCRPRARSTCARTRGSATRGRDGRSASRSRCRW